MFGCYCIVVASIFVGMALGFELGRRFAWLGVSALIRDGELMRRCDIGADRSLS